MSEASEQAALFEWAERFQGRAPELAELYHWPNGEYRTKAAAGRLAAQGVKRGPPDCWLFVPRPPYVGMVFEMKAKRGRLTTEQALFLAARARQGWRVGVFVEWLDAAEAVTRYLGYEPALLGLETRRELVRMVEGAP